MRSIKRGVGSGQWAVGELDGGWPASASGAPLPVALRIEGCELRARTFLVLGSWFLAGGWLVADGGWSEPAAGSPLSPVRVSAVSD